MGDEHPDAPLVRRLHDELLEAYRAAIGDRRRCALIDFPVHGNVGDSAIWMGQRRLLERLGVEVVHTCASGGFDAATVRRRLAPDGVVVLQGGGNFGDLYPAHHAVRLQALRELRDHPVVQLPVSVHFGDPAATAETVQALSEHPRCRVMARDQASARALTDLGAREVALVPDSAFGLLGSRWARAPRRRRARARHEQLWVLRTDEEAQPAKRVVAPNGVRVVDWLSREPGSPGYSRAHRAVQSACWRHLPRLRWWPRANAAASPLVLRAFDQLAAARLRFGRDLLAGADVVVSDRLHVHILSVLLGIPHVLVDTGYGKVTGFHERFTAESTLTAVASPDGARTAAARLAGRA